MSLDIRILEVLVSRICHDLISPISAVSNGAELVADMGGVTVGADDAFDLIRSSAVAASIKLQAFRLAYGAGGSEWHVSLDDVQKSFADYLGLEHRYRLEWNVIGTELPQPLPRGLPKLVMLICMWAMETLPKGGLIRVTSARPSDQEFAFTVMAEGGNAALKEGVQEAFAGTLPSDQLTPKTVHAAATGFYAKAYGVDVALDTATHDVVQFTLSTRL